MRNMPNLIALNSGLHPHADLLQLFRTVNEFCVFLFRFVAGGEREMEASSDRPSGRLQTEGHSQVCVGQ